MKDVQAVHTCAATLVKFIFSGLAIMYTQTGKDRLWVESVSGATIFNAIYVSNTPKILYQAGPSNRARNEHSESRLSLMAVQTAVPGYLVAVKDSSRPYGVLQ